MSGVPLDAMLTFVVIIVVSGALVLGAAWGIFLDPSDEVEGLLIALAGGALIVSAVLELIEPSIDRATSWAVYLAVLAGAVVFTALDDTIERHWGSDSGGGLLAAITLDGIPENLALGVALIGTGPREVAALSGAILLSNLPEAAGGAKEMANDDRSRSSVIALWTATAVLLSAAALAGNILLEGAGPNVLALIRSFAGGAVVASLATEVFPTAYREASHRAAIATTIGLILALFLNHIG